MNRERPVQGLSGPGATYCTKETRNKSLLQERKTCRAKQSGWKGKKQFSKMAWEFEKQFSWMVNVKFETRIFPSESETF